MREFRTHLSHYIDASAPVAVQRHGETVGYYIPVKPSPTEAERLALKRAGEQLDALLASKGLTEEMLMADYKALRRGNVD